MSRHITQFVILDSATHYMGKNYIKRKCGDLLYEALKEKSGMHHYAVRLNITSEKQDRTTGFHADARLYSVVVDVIDLPLLEATYDTPLIDLTQF